MNPLEFIKTKEDILSILEKIENRIIIQKDNEKYAKIYVDYDDDTRLEIKSTVIAYKTDAKLSGLTEIGFDYIHQYGNESLKVSADNVALGSLISDGKNIGLISSVTSDNQRVKFNLIYSEKTINWNDYEESI